MKNKSIFLILVGLLVLIFSQRSFADPPSSKDNYFKKMVIGAWILEDSTSYGEMMVLKDGNIIGKGMVKKENKKVEYAYKSTWDIINGMWVEKTTESTMPSMVGDSSIDKIISIDSDTFKLISQSGNLITLRRKK